MRLEDKELEGPDLEREQGLEELSDETHEHDRELPQLAGPEVVDTELVHRSRMFDALQAILAGENLAIPMLYLPQRETRALEALQAAVTGRDRSMNTFLFAEDRQALLEQALAVLQQNLTHGDAETLAVLSTKYDELTEHVADLRHQLLDLEDAQDDLIEQKQPRELAKPDATDTDDTDTSAEPGFLEAALDELDRPRPSTLTGPDLPEVAKPASTLDGSEDLDVAPRPTSLTGPDLPAPAAHVSALDAPGPEAAPPAYVSTLDGPERAEPAPRASQVYDPAAAPVIPAHLRPRLAAEQPTGMRTDGSLAPDREAHVDDGRGPAPPSTMTELRRAQAYEPPPAESARPTPSSTVAEPAARATPPSTAAEPSRSSGAEASTAAAPPRTPATEPAPVEAAPAKRRGLSVRSSEKPGTKK